jgi:hypothetical protein
VTRIAVLVLLVAACAEPGNKDAHLAGPDATPATNETIAWAARVDADTSSRPVRCESPMAASDAAEVHIRRLAGSATNLVAVYRGPGGYATENYYALRERVRLFQRIDHTNGNPATGFQPKTNFDSLWFADGEVTRWVDSLGRSRSLGRRSVGARAENIQKSYERWRSSCPPA